MIKYPCKAQNIDFLGKKAVRERLKNKNYFSKGENTMKKRRTLVISALLVAALALGIGYAALSSVMFNITGTAKVNAVQENFLVKFTGTPAVENCTASISADRMADIAVNSLTKPGKTAKATFTIINDKDNGSLYAAKLGAIQVATDATGHFLIEVENKADLENKILEPGDSTTVVVKVTLLDVPMDVQSANIDIKFTATPQLAADESETEGELT